MKDYRGIVVLNNGVVHEYIMEVKDKQHAENKLKTKAEYDGLFDIYKYSVQEVK